MYIVCVFQPEESQRFFYVRMRIYVCMCNHGYFNILSSFYHFLKDRKSRNLSDFPLVQDDFS